MTHLLDVSASTVISQYAVRWQVERTHSYDQEVIAKGSAVKMRGLAALSFAGAIRTLRQLLRRACNFVLDAAYTLGRLHPLRIWWIAGPLGAPGPGDA